MAIEELFNLQVIAVESGLQNAPMLADRLNKSDGKMIDARFLCFEEAGVMGVCEEGIPVIRLALLTTGSWIRRIELRFISLKRVDWAESRLATLNWINWVRKFELELGIYNTGQSKTRENTIERKNKNLM